MSNKGIEFASMTNSSIIADAFWVYFFFQWGLLGSGLWFYLFIKLIKYSKSDLYNNDNKLVNSVVFLLIFGSFANQLILIRPFSLIFWILIGLMFNKNKYQLVQ